MPRLAHSLEFSLSISVQAAGYTAWTNSSVVAMWALATLAMSTRCLPKDTCKRCRDVYVGGSKFSYYYTHDVERSAA